MQNTNNNNPISVDELEDIKLFLDLQCKEPNDKDDNEKEKLTSISSHSPKSSSMKK